MHFSVKTHKKDNHPFNQIARFIAYFFEKNYTFSLNSPIVLLFDMTDAGYSNVDLEMTKFVVNCLKSYYPGLISKILYV